MTQTAYAVAVKGQIDMNVMHGHARGAMVNFLCTQVAPWNTPEGQRAMAGWDDQRILDTFVSLQRTYPDIQLVIVGVSVLLTEDPTKVADLTAAPPSPPGYAKPH